MNFIIEEGLPQDGAIKRGDLGKLISKAGGCVLRSQTKATKDLFNVQILGAEENSQDYSRKRPLSKKINYKDYSLSHRWILDSISQHELLEPSIYII